MRFHSRQLRYSGSVEVPNRPNSFSRSGAAGGVEGLHWDVRPIPNSGQGRWDPSVGIASDGTLNCYQHQGYRRPVLL